jgi:hypothetical protein
MSKKIARSIIWLVVGIMTFICISAALTSSHNAVNQHDEFAEKEAKSSFLSSIVFEKAEEESEKTEEERDNVFTVELADLSQITMVLSYIHTPKVEFVPAEHLYDGFPSLLTLLCTLNI